jgi:RNA polymerase sigma factor (sigma-70 family)
MDELVRSHMPLIFRVAGRSAQNPGVDINDLIQTATEGLLVAINRWSFEKSDASGAVYANDIAQDSPPAQPLAPTSEPNPEQDDVHLATASDVVHSSRLATYAVWWMRIMLTNSIIDNRGVVVRAKNPKVRKALFSLPATINRLEINLPLSGNDVKRIADCLGIEEQFIEEALVHAAGDVMLDEPVGDGNLLRGDVIADARAEGENGILARLAAADCWDAICEALLELSPRDRFILITRYLSEPKWKLDRLSDTLKMSRERIRQIGCDALARIRSSVGPAGARHEPAGRQAVQQVEALVSCIEQASASADPDDLATFLIEQKIAVGPTRIIRGSSVDAPCPKGRPRLQPIPAP